MAKQRSLVRMSQEEVDGFLAQEMKVHVATVNPDGSPHLATLFYVLDGGQIAFWTYGRSQKIRNLERDPRITCLVESGDDYFQLRGVSVAGTAEIVRDHDRILEIGSAVATRMVGGADVGEVGRAEVDRQALKRVAVVVTPEKVATWDHSKMVAAVDRG